MKKLFVALMAVLMFASCGGDGDKKTNPGQVIDKIISNTETLLQKAERAVRTDNPEIFVSAFERYADQMVDIYNKYGDTMSNMSREEQNKYRGKAYEMMELMEEVEDFLENEVNQLEPTPSQEKRVLRAAEKLEILD